MANSFIFSSESVTEGHPDKVCDTISDAVLDACLQEDAFSRVACETMVKDNAVILGGEITTKAKFDYCELVKEVLVDMNYDSCYAQGTDYSYTCKFDAQGFFLLNLLGQQSPDIKQGVDDSAAIDKETVEQGAGDQGIMFGYACREGNKLLMPAPIFYADAIMRRHHELFKAEKLSGLRPDAKAMVWAEYRDGKFLRIDKVLVSTQHEANQLQKIRELVKEEIVKPVLGKRGRYAIKVNPKGSFVEGGPGADTGLTGRKIVVDTYGGSAPHGGGAFSGKDPSKVDRSGAYAARYIAKNIVASKIAEKCLIQLAYVIGVSKPLSIYVDLFDGDDKKSKHVKKLIKDNFDLSPRGIREMLSLNKPIYECTAAYGHFGRKPRSDGSFSWEKTDKTEVFKK